MTFHLVVSALEEELLYVFYDDYLLKRSLLAVEEIAVTLDTSQGHFFPRQFSLVLKTEKGQRLILENGCMDGFMETFRTYKRLETEQDEWFFLDELLNELKEEMPRYLQLVEGILQKRLTELLSIKAFLPGKVELLLREETMNKCFDEENLENLWSNAWRRFVEQKETYFWYMGFDHKQFDQVKNLRIENLMERQHEHATEIVSTIKQGEANHQFSFYKGNNPVFETHLTVDGELVFENDALGGFSVSSTGMTIGEFFGIEKRQGYDFDKMWKSFLSQEPELYQRSLECFAEQNKQDRLNAVENTAGLFVMDSYLENDTHVIVLEDGRQFKELR